MEGDPTKEPAEAADDPVPAPEASEVAEAASTGAELVAAETADHSDNESTGDEHEHEDAAPPADPTPSDAPASEPASSADSAAAVPCSGPSGSQPSPVATQIIPEIVKAIKEMPYTPGNNAQEESRARTKIQKGAQAQQRRPHGEGSASSGSTPSTPATPATPATPSPARAAGPESEANPTHGPTPNHPQPQPQPRRASVLPTVFALALLMVAIVLGAYQQGYRVARAPPSHDHQIQQALAQLASDVNASLAVMLNVTSHQANISRSTLEAILTALQGLDQNASSPYSINGTLQILSDAATTLTKSLQSLSQELNDEKQKSNLLQESLKELNIKYAELEKEHAGEIEFLKKALEDAKKRLAECIGQVKPPMAEILTKDDTCPQAGTTVRVFARCSAGERRLASCSMTGNQHTAIPDCQFPASSDRGGNITIPVDIVLSAQFTKAFISLKCVDQDGKGSEDQLWLETRLKDSAKLLLPATHDKVSEGVRSFQFNGGCRAPKNRPHAIPRKGWTSGHKLLTVDNNGLVTGLESVSKGKLNFTLTCELDCSEPVSAIVVLEVVEPVVLGIDVGTGTFCVVYTDPATKETHVVDSRHVFTSSNVVDDDVCFPSVVAVMNNGSIVVAEAALDVGTDPAKVTIISDIKRMLGIEWTPAIQATHPLAHPRCGGTELHCRQIAVEVLIGNEKKLVDVRYLMAELLRYAKDLAYTQLGVYMADVVLTLPAQWNPHQTNATLQAAEMAGLHVLTTISEPAAAAIALRAALPPIDPHKPAVAMVIDIGQGTTDFTIANIYRSAKGQLPIVRVASVGGIPLAGGDFTKVLQGVLSSKLGRELVASQGKTQPEAMKIVGNLHQELSIRAEAAKKELSNGAAEVKVKIGLDAKNNHIVLTVSQKEFIEASQKLFDELEAALVKFKSQAKVTEISILLAVGGGMLTLSLQARMQKACQTGQTKLNAAMLVVVNGDSLLIDGHKAATLPIAAGAAYVGFDKVFGTGTLLDELRLTSTSYKVWLGGNRFDEIFTRNQPYPCYHIKNYRPALANQTSSIVKSFSGECKDANSVEYNLPDPDCVQLGLVELYDKNGFVDGIDVTFTLNDNGLLSTFVDSSTSAMSTFTNTAGIPYYILSTYARNIQSGPHSILPVLLPATTNLRSSDLFKVRVHSGVAPSLLPLSATEIKAVVQVTARFNHSVPSQGGAAGTATAVSNYVVLVLDISGSMVANGGCTLVFSAVAQLLDFLAKASPDSFVSIVVFASSSTDLLGGGFQKVSTVSKQAITDKLGRLDCNGGTNMQGALKATFDQIQKVKAALPRAARFSILLLSDGQPDSPQEKTLPQFVETSLSGFESDFIDGGAKARPTFCTLGFTAAAAHAFMQKLSALGGGSSAYTFIPELTNMATTHLGEQLKPCILAAGMKSLVERQSEPMITITLTDLATDVTMPEGGYTTRRQGKTLSVLLDRGFIPGEEVNIPLTFTVKAQPRIAFHQTVASACFVVNNVCIEERALVIDRIDDINTTAAASVLEQEARLAIAANYSSLWKQFCNTPSAQQNIDTVRAETKKVLSGIATRIKRSPVFYAGSPLVHCLVDTIELAVHSKADNLGKTTADVCLKLKEDGRNHLHERGLACYWSKEVQRGIKL